MVALHQGRLVLVKQTRKGKSHPTFELPGGRIHAQESILAGAKRELREETGLIVEELTELGTFTTPLSPITVTLFFTSSIAGQTDQQLDADEDIEVIYTDIAEAFRNVGSGIWPDARLGFGLLLARSRGLI